MSAKVTAQDMLSKFGPLIKAKAAELTKFASDFQATDGVEKALIIHNHFLETNETAEAITKDAQNVQRPVSIDDGKKVLKLVKETQVSYNIIVDYAIKKKPYFDALPVGNINALISQDIKLLYGAAMALADALLDAVPAELETEAKAARKELEDAAQPVMAIYQ